MEEWGVYRRNGKEIFRNLKTGVRLNAEEMALICSGNEMNQIRTKCAKYTPVAAMLSQDQIEFFKSNKKLVRNEVIRKALDEFIKNYEKK